MNRKFLIFLLAGALLGIAGSKWYSAARGSDQTDPSLQKSTPEIESARTLQERQNEEIPPKVYMILKYVETFHEPKEGYKGGTVFHNYEELLPKKRPNGNPIHYKEWDVNPYRGILKRGGERLVTGDNKSAWYTNDHYKSFIKIH